MTQAIVSPSKIRDRVRETMRLRGLKARPWSLAATGKPDTVRNIIRGKSISPQIQTLEKLAREAKVSLDWLRGIAETPDYPPNQQEAAAPVTVPFIGYIGAGEQIFPISLSEAQENDRIAAPAGLGEAVAAKVRGDSMKPAYRDGDTVFASIHRGPIDELAGEDCFVQLASGAFYLKHLRRGSQRGSWELLSYNPDIQPIKGEKIVNAAPVRWVLRAPRGGRRR